MIPIIKKRTGHDVPPEHFFNCNLFKQETNVKHLLTHTGYHYEIIESVLTHSKFHDVVWKSFQQTWKDWYESTKTDDYKAAFICKSGCHRSVAAMLGAKAFFELIQIPVEVVLVNKDEWCSQECVIQCWNCKPSLEKQSMIVDSVKNLMAKQ